MKNNKTKFQTYLSSLGDVVASRKLAIAERVAKAYRLGQRRPKLANIPVLIKRSNGCLTFASFFPENKT